MRQGWLDSTDSILHLSTPWHAKRVQLYTPETQFSILSSFCLTLEPRFRELFKETIHDWSGRDDSNDSSIPWLWAQIPSSPLHMSPLPTLSDMTDDTLCVLGGESSFSPS